MFGFRREETWLNHGKRISNSSVKFPVTPIGTYGLRSRKCTTAKARRVRKENRRPPHAVESAFMGRDILKQSLMPLLKNTLMQIATVRYIAHAVVMAAQHHSGQGRRFTFRNKTPSQAQAIISKSWDSLARFFPRLPLQKPI